MQSKFSDSGDPVGQLHQISSHLTIFSKFSKRLYTTRLSSLHLPKG